MMAQWYCLSYLHGKVRLLRLIYAETAKRLLLTIQRKCLILMRDDLQFFYVPFFGQLSMADNCLFHHFDK